MQLPQQPIERPSHRSNWTRIFISLFLFAINPFEHIVTHGNNYGYFIGLFLYISIGIAVSTKTLHRITNQYTDADQSSGFLSAVIAPIFCLRYDLGVFTKDGILENIAYTSYLGIMLGIVAYIYWRMKSSHPPWITGIIAGILLCGSVFSFVIGIILTPFSILGLTMLFGVFGFIPYITGYTYFKSGIKAFHQAKDSLRVPKLLIAFIPGIIIISPFLFFALSFTLRYILKNN